MKTLTDPRVKYERAPFDHPQLFIPNGHVGNEKRTLGGAFGDPKIARTEWLELPAVGASGRGAIDTFDQTLGRGTPNLPVASRFDPSHILTFRSDTIFDRSSPVGSSASNQYPQFVADGSTDASGRVFYSASGLPLGVKLGNTGHLRGVARRPGDYLVTVIAYDALGATGQATFNWTVR